MAVVLESERTSAKARMFHAVIYAALVLGAVTMVYPFAVMISASLSSAYDYHRHDAVPLGFFSRADRFVRSIATYFPSFPRDVYPDAPAGWTAWAQVAADREGVRHFAAKELGKYSDAKKLAAARERADAFLCELAADDGRRTVCNCDARDVAGFVKSRYGSLESLNAAWPVPHKSFFDVSFSAESRADSRPVSATAPPAAAGPKAQAWRAMKRWYLDEAIRCGDHISRTMPADIDAACAERIREALAVQFLDHGWRDFLCGSLANYRLVGDFLFLRGRAFANTILLVVLSVLASLTVNPLAAYALSRFRLRATEQIILFLLATMAFPAAVTAIPGFLLIRDLGLLNTFAALVLPGVASGMSIFILKGFFDALPRELYEAAAIDGASEWTVFRRITLPMTTPILAVNALNSFIHAYSSWEWAFLVCQKESHWTLAVWMYQVSQTFAHQPWCVMAGFVLVSVPTAAVFLACQKVILRGIVLPSMK